MANEVLMSNLERANSVLSAQFDLLDAAREAAPLHPAILQAGNVANIGNNVIKVRLLGLDGYDVMASATEIEDIANTAFTDASVNVTVARRTLSYDASAISLDTDDVLSWERFARSLAVSALVSETRDLLALSTGFTGTSLGNDATEFSLTTLLAAISALEASDVGGPYLMAGHTSHKRGLRLEQILSVGGQMQYMEPAGVAAGQTGAAGSLFGVDLFFSNRAPTSGTGRAGMLVGRGAILRALLTPTAKDSRQTVAGNVKIAYGYTEGTDIDTVTGHAYYGLAEFRDARGVQLVVKL